MLKMVALMCLKTGAVAIVAALIMCAIICAVARGRSKY